MATISLDKISSSCETALKNHLILSRIFQYLDLTSLKAVRLVCKNWDVEAIKKFRNFDIIIRLEPPFESEKWEHLQRLLNLRDDFHPILFLSFQSPAWVYYSLISQFGAFEFENENFQKVWATLNDVLNSNFEPRQTSCDFRVFELLTQIGVCVRELRLELTLLNETDAEYVVQLLSAFPNLEKFYLDIVDVGDEGLLGFPLITTPPDNSTPTGFLPPSLVTLGLRIYGEPDEDESHITVGGHGVSLDAVTHFMKTCSISNIQLLDFEGWAYQDLLPQDEVVKMMWMTAISKIMNQEPNPFPKLNGIRVGWHPRDEDEITEPQIHNLASLPRSMTHLDLNAYITGDQLHQILRQHATILRTLDLTYLENLGPLNSLRFPLLTTFEVDICHEFSKIRVMFLNGPQSFQRTFPSLSTIGVFTSLEKPEVWEDIFPRENSSGERLEFRQIKVLNISLKVDDRDDDKQEDNHCLSQPQIIRILAIFPSLHTLRHIRKRTSDGVLFVCRHVRRSDVVWSTAAKTWRGRGGQEFLSEGKRISRFFTPRLRYLLMKSHESQGFEWY